MTFRLPFITPARRTSLQSTPDSTQALNLQLLKNPIPFDNSGRLLIPAVRIRESLRDIHHTDILLYPNPIPIDNSRLLIPSSRVKLYVPDVTHTDILLYPNPIPINNAVLLVPSTRVKSSPPDQIHLNILLPIPFNQQDWAKLNILPDWSVPAQYPNIVLNTVQNPTIPFDWGKLGVLPDFLPSGTIQTNINLFTNPIPFLTPDFTTSRNIPDWLPPTQYPNLVLVPTVAQNPFYTQDFSRPLTPVPAKPDQQALNLNLYTNPIPFAQYDWSKPQGIRGQPDQVYTDLVLQNFSTPFVQTDWSKGSTTYIRLDQIYPNIILLQPVQVPFIPVDYSKPITVASVPSPAMGSNQNLFTNPIPFNQYDWTKLWGVRPIVSDQNNLPNIAGTNPSQPSTPLGLFGWTDWNKVKAPVILMPDQDNLPNLVLIINPIVPPVVFTPSGRYLKGYEDKLRNRLPTPSEQIRKAAAVLSSAGGHARAQSLTAKQRTNIASNAAKARWR